MAIITLDTVRLLADIPINENGISPLDAKIEKLIEYVEKDFLTIRGVAFDLDADGKIIYPANAELTAFKMVQFHLSGAIMEAGELANERHLSGYPTSIVNSIERFVRALT